MKHKFEDLNAIQSREFLRQFQALIRGQQSGMIHGDGRASFVDGQYVTVQAAKFEYEDTDIFAEWRIVQTHDGCLVSISCDTPAAGAAQDRLLDSLVSRVLERVITGRRSSFYQRAYFRAVHGFLMPGEYWVSDLRFAQLFPQDDCTLVTAERIYVIDHCVDAVDATHAREVSLRKAALATSYLSLILDIGLDDPVKNDIYTLQRDKATFTMKRRSTQLIDQGMPKAMPAKGDVCSHAEFTGSVYDHGRHIGSQLSLPTETRRIFRLVKQASPEILAAFGAACRMYQLSLVLGERRPSVRASYQYGAIDSIVKTDVKAHRSFTDFMMKYGQASRALCDALHSQVRSAHWHSGCLPLGELDFDQGPQLFSPGKMPLFDFTQKSHELMRTAILRWLDEEIGFSTATGQ